VSLPVIQLKCGTSGNAVPTMLLKCGTAVNAVPTLLRACPPPSDDLPDGCYGSPCFNCEDGAEKRTPFALYYVATGLPTYSCEVVDSPVYPFVRYASLTTTACSGPVTQLGQIYPCNWSSSGSDFSYSADYWDRESYTSDCAGEPTGNMSFHIRAQLERISRNMWRFWLENLDASLLPLWFDAMAETENCRTNPIVFTSGPATVTVTRLC
jgi:hypothetical protein